MLFIQEITILDLILNFLSFIFNLSFPSFFFHLQTYYYFTIMLSILIDACAITLKFSFYNPFLLFITILILWDNFPHSFIYQNPLSISLTS